MASSLDDLDGIIGGASGEDEDIFPCFEDLTPFEVEYFVNDIEEHKLEEVGNKKWLTHHERIEKLNWTAHNQAKESLDEFVVDQFNMLEKGPLLIYDLILSEVWKEKIWPLVKDKIAKFSSLRTYIPVYHEASVANLIEILLYHRTSCEECGDALIDLVDWCIRKLRYLLSKPNHELVRQVTSAKECVEWDQVRCIDEQFLECEFQVCMCAISILRFMTDHRVAMPLAVTTRLLETHDVLMLLVPLMEKAPWVRKDLITGKIQKFEEHKWERVEEDDAGRLPKLHMQVWITIYNLVMDGECRNRYELTSYRKDNLLRLRRFINEVVVDQLPPLTNLHRTLEEMSISGQFTGVAPPTAASPFVVEMVAEARETLDRSYEGRWQEVADLQLREVLVKETPQELKRLGQMISVPKEMFEDPPDAPASSAWPTGGDPAAVFSGADSSSGGGYGSAGSSRSAGSGAWEAVLKLPLVSSTASFFAAARAAAGDAPVDEVIMLSAIEDQPPPREGEKLRLELRRARHAQLCAGTTAQERVACDAALNSKRQDADGTYLLAVEAPKASQVRASMRSLPLLSSKGAAKTAVQLRNLLEKPGRESLLAMYTENVAEFSVPVGEGGLNPDLVDGLGLS